MTEAPTGICRDCALDAGAEAPENHLASCWDGKCIVCEVIKSVCCTTDWLWPSKTD